MKKLNRTTKLTALVAVLLMTAFAYQGCATLDKGADPIAVRAEQTYQAAQDVAEFLFTYEDTNEAALEAKFPGFHKNVEQLRVNYKLYMPRLLTAIDTYKATRNEGALVVAMAFINQMIRDMQNGIVYAELSGGV